MTTKELLALALECLDYAPETGEFRWKKRPGRNGPIKAGGIAGRRNSRGYMQVSLKGESVKAHRLAWLLVYGEMPGGDIDHINGIRTDNRITNLRAVTRAENQHAVFKPNKNSKTGLRGVAPIGSGFKAAIRTGRKKIYLGWFSTKEAARAAYLAAKEKYHPASAISKPHFIKEPK